MSVQQQNILNLFHQNMLSFLDELIETFPSEPELIMGRVLVSTQVSPKLLMDQFILNVLPHKQAIRDKDDSIFLESKLHVFGKLDSSRVDYWKNIWKSSHMDTENKEAIWEWLYSFIGLAVQYQRIVLP